MQKALARGSTAVFSGDSILDLAQKIGANPAVLQATIDEYNQFCEIGHDEMFAKEPQYLRPLKEPPYYALKVNTVFLGTLGGIKINHRMEVLDKRGRVIPGLYAAGADAGGLYGDSYCFKETSGAALGFAGNSGRIAGRNVLQYLRSLSM